MDQTETKKVRDDALDEAAAYVRALAEALRKLAGNSHTSRVLHEGTAANFEDVAAGIAKLKITK